MKELEQKAEILRIIKKYRDGEYLDVGVNEIYNLCAIQSVNHTIETLENLRKKHKEYKHNTYIISEELNEQIELKNILEGRL
jgi:hypothetical protein